jgi:hypothetical protein
MRRQNHSMVASGTRRCARHFCRQCNQRRGCDVLEESRCACTSALPDQEVSKLLVRRSLPRQSLPGFHFTHGTSFQQPQWQSHQGSLRRIPQTLNHTPEVSELRSEQQGRQLQLVRCQREQSAHVTMSGFSADCSQPSTIPQISPVPLHRHLHAWIWLCNRAANQ